MKLKHYSAIKIDHDEDCAIYNENDPFPKALCTCGLFPNFYTGITNHIKEHGSFIHEGEKDSIVNSFQGGFNFKQLGSDIEFLLDEFKSDEKDMFDENGEFLTAIRVSKHQMELMRHLIFKMEECLQQKDERDLA